MSTPIETLRIWMAQIHDLRDAALILDWDQHTMMPRRGAESRAEVISTLERIRHDKLVCARTGELIDAAELSEGQPVQRGRVKLHQRERLIATAAGRP